MNVSSITSTLNKAWALISKYPILVCLACYLPNILIYSNEPWIYDDNVAVTRNPCIIGVNKMGRRKGWDCLLTVDYWGTPIHLNESHKSYRPVTSFLFRLQNTLWGTKDSRPWHLVSVLLHGVCSQLIVILARLCLPNEETVIHRLVGLFFAVHPIHTESVSNITGCCEILCGIFMILSFIAFTQLSPFVGHLVACLCIVLATLSKEMGFTVVGVMLVYLIAKEMHQVKGETKTQLSFKSILHVRVGTVVRVFTLLVTGAAIFVIRLSIQRTPPQYSPWQNPAGFHPNRLTRILSLTHVALKHGYLMLWPYILCPDYSNMAMPTIDSFLDQRMLLVVFTIAALITAIFFIIRYSIHADTNATPLLLSLAWLLLPFVPSSNVFFPVGFTIAERVLYTPSIGYCLLLGLGCGTLLRWTSSKTLDKSKAMQMRSHVWAVIAGVIGVMFVRTFLRDIDWNHTDNLWSTSVKSCPPNAVYYGNLALVRQSQRQFEDAEYLQLRAIEYAKPFDNSLAQHNLALLYIDKLQYEKAASLCKPRADQGDLHGLYCMGIIKMRQGIFSEAKQMFEYVLENGFQTESTNTLDYWSVLSSLLYSINMYSAQVNDYKHVIQMANNILNVSDIIIPQETIDYVHEQLVYAYKNAGNISAMEKELSKTLTNNPNNPHIYAYAIRVCMEVESFQKGQHFARLAAERFHDHPKVRLELNVFKKYLYIRMPDRDVYKINEKFLNQGLEQLGHHKEKLLYLVRVARSRHEEDIAIHALLLMYPIVKEIESYLPKPGSQSHYLYDYLMRMNTGQYGPIIVFRDLSIDGIAGFDTFADRIEFECMEAMSYLWKSNVDQKNGHGKDMYMGTSKQTAQQSTTPEKQTGQPQSDGKH